MSYVLTHFKSLKILKGTQVNETGQLLHASNSSSFLFSFSSGCLRVIPLLFFFTFSQFD